MTRRDDEALPEDALPERTLDALRAAFDALPAPEPARELSEEDATTQRTVAWLAAAYRSLPVPEATLPGATLPAPRAAITPLPTARTRAPWSRVAAAAALLLASLALVWLLRERGPGPQALRDATADVPLPAFPAPTLVAAAPDRIELTSGPVRLVLFTDLPVPTQEIPR